MKVRPLMNQFGISFLALAFMGPLTPQAFADHHHSQAAKSHDHKYESKHKKAKGEFVKAVRKATKRYRDVRLAEADGYHLNFGCVSGPDIGAMGLHFANLSLIGDGKLEVARPEIILYEQQPNGRLRLTGVDYLVPVEAWHANNEGQPILMGQLLQLFPSPNRFGLPVFYTLHVWAWEDNPLGTFGNWNPRVSCDSFDGQGR